ncbi:hypothetical protein ABT085_46420, partial [Streptomyces sp. NPDC002265]
ARSANYSANMAIDSARSALRSSYSAQASARSARASAIAAGKDAATASAAATEARNIAASKRKLEVLDAADKAAAQARQNRANGTDPADSSTHDHVNSDGSNGDNDEWYTDAGFYADAFNYISIGTGFVAAGLGMASLAFPPLAPVAMAFGYVSLGTAAISTVFTGFEYGFGSREFAMSAAGTALGLITFGQSQAIGALGKVAIKGVVTEVAPVATHITQFAHDLVSPVTGLLSLF